ncbi:tripartite tricarboxylate transporter TctB family protein [Histidinibacterium aquaticum]|nr:tripartite tricarboxylate transporter TctB family protein [Histidinibacterium aquaticum]
MALADRISAVVFLALGIALFVGGWTMDRLEIRRIHPASIPGLVPMILGVLLAICAVLLFRSSYTDTERGKVGVLVGGSWSRLGLTAILCTGYALGLVGWLSYFWATAIFTFAFALVFSLPVDGARRDQAIAVAGSLALAFGVAFSSSILFRELFLVRLP